MKNKKYNTMKNRKNNSTTNNTAQRIEMPNPYSDFDTPIDESAKIVIFEEYAEDIPYIGVCSEQITEFAKRDSSFIYTLKTICYDIIILKPLPLFSITYIDDDTNEQFEFIIRHGIEDNGVHLFYFYTSAESNIVNETPTAN